MHAFKTTMEIIGHNIGKELIANKKQYENINSMVASVCHIFMLDGKAATQIIWC